MHITLMVCVWISQTYRSSSPSTVIPHGLLQGPGISRLYATVLWWPLVFMHFSSHWSYDDHCFVVCEITTKTIQTGLTSLGTSLPIDPSYQTYCASNLLSRHLGYHRHPQWYPMDCSMDLVYHGYMLLWYDDHCFVVCEITTKTIQTGLTSLGASLPIDPSYQTYCASDLLSHILMSSAW